MFRPLSFVLITALFAVSASAHQTVTNALVFEPDAPQSSWRPGQGRSDEETFRVGTPFAGDTKIGIIFGSEFTPNVLHREAQKAFDVLQSIYVEALIQYGRARQVRNAIQREIDRINDLNQARDEINAACRQVIGGFCDILPALAMPNLPELPERPTPPHPVTVPRYIDTRHGDQVTLDVAGTATLSLATRVNAGTVLPRLQYTGSVTSRQIVAPGEVIRMDATGQMRGGTLNGLSPGIDAIVTGKMTLTRVIAEGVSCEFLKGCTTSNLRREGKNVATVTREFVRLDNKGVKFFDVDLGDTLPDDMLEDLLDGPEIKAAIDVEVVANIDVTTPTVPLGLVVNGVQLPPEFAFGVGVDLARTTLEVPLMDIPGKVDGNMVGGRARDDLFKANIDIDAALGLFGGLNVGNSFAAISGDLWDVDGGVFLDAFQDLALASSLRVGFAFDAPVAVNGTRVRQTRFFPLNALPEMAFFETTHVTPIYALDAKMRNVTGVQAGLEIVADVIKVTANVGPVSNDLIGPIASFPAELTDNQRAAVPLFDDVIRFVGFEPQPGDPFTVVVRQ